MNLLDIVCGVMVKDGKVLIARRGKGISENTWEFPGGKVEKGESYEVALQRELEEELGVKTKVNDFLLDVVNYQAGEWLHVHAYVCTILDGIPTLHVHHEIVWIAPAQIAAYRFRDSDQPIIERVMELVK